MPPIQFVVDRRAAGQTLAAALKIRFGLTWAQAKRLVENGHVRVSGQVETDVARRLKLGKRVELAAGTVENKATGVRNQGSGGKDQPAGAKKPGTEGRKTPPNAPAKKPDAPKPKPKPAAAQSKPVLSPDVIVYVDDAVVVVNKPAGLTTMRHKDEADEFGAGQRFLTKTLAGLLPGLLGTPDRAVTAVHRLDRDTSGLVVFARTRAAGEHLTEQFRRHRTERRYLALTRGTPEPGRIASVFVSDRGDGRRGSTTDLAAEDGKRAVTHVAVVEELRAFALVECRLETGRTHQVRIHLGETGAPLCGETVYDRPIDGRPFPDGSGAARPMLHAVRLGFVHPDTGAAMSWEVEPPADFQQLLAKLRDR